MPRSLIFVAVVMILGVAYLIRRHKPHYEPIVHRLHPGVADKAEWMAPSDVVIQVALDYGEVQRWAAEALTAGYPRYLRELPKYFSGEALTEQSRIVLRHVRRSGTRLVGLLEAEHEVQVRRFSSDGKTCYLFDRQSRQQMITYDYWTKRRISSQPLGDGLYVYRMILDTADQRWKIAQRVQQLPVGCSISHEPTASVQLTDRLPTAIGRDW
jgi:hypothetical protein